MAKINRSFFSGLFAIVICLFTLFEVNYPNLAPQTQMALFVLLGLSICFLHVPIHPSLRENRVARASDFLLLALTLLCFGFVITQSEPALRGLWINGQSLGNRAGQETAADFVFGIVGLVLVLEATRRSIGWVLPLLSVFFLAYALLGQYFPDWLFPHRGYSLERTVSQTFLQGQGVFGMALNVMFTYVFLFIIFGAFLQATGATQFIIDFARKFFRRSPGGAAKVAVLSSGLMGSLSGSAVANTVTTGTFTIPMMRAAGYSRVTAGAVEAAASTGGALVPPVMGAAAYMMLEIVTPPVTYLQIIKSALIPAVLYYLSLFCIVHFHSKRIGAATGIAELEGDGHGRVLSMPALVFIGAFSSLLMFLFMGYTAFRAVTLSLVVILVLSAFHRKTRLNLKQIGVAFIASGRDVVPLLAAAACVGIILGVVTLTGVGNKFPALILPLAEGSLFLALVIIMAASIVLGMGLPSAVCYLLMATLIGPVLGGLGVVPLAAHLFIFYFGMMSMVTPPVALAGFAASSIAGSPLMATSFAAFRFALVGFTLPYMFVFRPELLLLAPDGEPANLFRVFYAVAIAVFGIVSLAAAIAGYLIRPVSKGGRGLLITTAILLLYPGQTFLFPGSTVPLHDGFGVILFGIILFLNWKGFGLVEKIAAPPAAVASSNADALK